METKAYTIQITTSIDEALLAQWQNLWNRAENATIFNSAEWFFACLQAENTNEYTIITCYDGNSLVGILPLKKNKKFGIPVLSVMSTYYQVDTPFLLASYDKELLRQFFSYLLEKGNIYLTKLDYETVTKMQSLFPHLFFSLMSVNPCIPTTGELYTSMSPTLSGRIKKILRKNAGQFTFILHKDNLEKQLQTMISIDQASWKQGHHKDIFCEQETQKAFQAITRHCHRFVRIGFLYYQNKPIAYFFGFLYGKTFAAYQTSFLSEYRQLRPGQTALFCMMENLKDSVTTIDMGGGISRYKMEFTQDYRLLYDVYYSKNDAVMLWWKLINALRRIKQIVYHTKNTRDHEFLFKTLTKNKKAYSINKSYEKYSLSSTH